MPYRNAPYYMLACIGIILLGFWPTYFSATTTAPWQFHAHGVAAGLWVLMVTGQSWTAQHKNQLQLHRTVGKASLFLFPFLIGGLAAIISRQGQDYVAGDPVNLLDGPGFLIGTIVAIAAYVTVYYRALKYRRKVWVHAGYMLSTPLILFESPFSRAMGILMPARFGVAGPADFPHIMETIIISCVIELAIIAIIWWRVRERATPFLVTGGFIVVEMLTMVYAGNIAALRWLDVIIGRTPGPLIWATGFAIGAATSWLGWQAGKQGAMAPRAVAQPA
jgi:hypothetical protein